MSEEQRPVRGRIAERRSLNGNEVRLLEWLLAHGTDEAAAYRQQMSHVTVVARCDCGCPTIELAVEGQTAVPGRPSSVLADSIGRSPEGVLCGIILHARDGLLSELEAYSQAGDGPFSLPDLEQAATYEDLRARNIIAESTVPLSPGTARHRTEPIKDPTEPGARM